MLLLLLLRPACGSPRCAAALGLEGAARSQLLLLFGALPPAVVQYLLAERCGQGPERVAAMVCPATRSRCCSCRSRSGSRALGLW